MADESTYQLGVYREVDTGKLRVKGATRIEPFELDSPPDPVEEKFNELLALLDAAGINPEA